MLDRVYRPVNEKKTRLSNKREALFEASFFRTPTLADSNTAMCASESVHPAGLD